MLIIIIFQKYFSINGLDFVPDDVEIRQQMVSHCLRIVLLRSNLVQYVYWSFLLEKRQGSKNDTQRSEDTKDSRHCRLQRQDAVSTSFGMATGPKQLHAQEIHSQVHESTQRRLRTTSQYK